MILFIEIYLILGVANLRYFSISWIFYPFDMLYTFVLYGRYRQFLNMSRNRFSLFFLKLTWNESSDNFFYLIACCPLFAVSHFSISSPKQVNISTKLTAGYPLVKGLQIYPRERTPLQVEIWLQYVGNELATNFFFRTTESSLPY